MDPHMRPYLHRTKFRQVFKCWIGAEMQKTPQGWRLKETTSKISEYLKMATKYACDDSFQIKKCTKQVIIKYITTTQIISHSLIVNWNIPALKDTCDVEKKAQSK